MIGKQIPEYSSIILINTKNEILLQLRDNNPNIADPNTLSLFAGRMEPGESKEQTIKRELYEETTIEADNMAFLFTFETDMKRFGRVARSHVFLLKGVDETKVHVQEGQGYRKITSKSDLEQHDFALISKDILHIYFERYAS